MKLVLVIPPCGFCWDQDAVVETLTTWGWWASLCGDCALRIGGPEAGWRELRAGAAEPPLVTEAEAGAYVESQTYTFARTMPKWPHEYCLITRSTDPALQLRVLAWIRRTGELRMWRGQRGRLQPHHYWKWRGWEYWSLPDRETILNRRHLDWPNDGTGTGDPRKQQARRGSQQGELLDWPG